MVEEEFFLWPENKPALDMFRKVSTQWIIRDGLTGTMLQGIKYSSLISVINLFCDDDPRALFDDVCSIEAGALMEFKEQRDDKESS